MHKYIFLVLSALICDTLTLHAKEITPIPAVQATVQSRDTGKSLEYAYIYNETSQDVMQGAAISFDFNGQITRGIKHEEKSAEIIFEKTGVYQVNFLGVSIGSGSVALFLNGILVEGSTYGSSISTNFAIQVIIAVNAGDTLTVRSYSPELGHQGGVALKTSVRKGRQKSTNASLLIIQLT